MQQPENEANNTPAAEMMGQQLIEGTPVYDRNGAKIGTVDGFDAQANILAVRKGFFFPHNFYAPLSAITRSDPDGVYLSMTDEDLKGDGYAVASQAMTSDMAPITTSQTAQVRLTSTSYASDDADDSDNDADDDLGDDAEADAFTAQQTPTVAQPTLISPVDLVDGGVGEITLPLAEEQLVPQVETVALGDVHLHKGVRMVERQVTVPVSHDEVVIEHIAPDQFDASQPIPTGEIIIPILEEQVITQTYTVVKEYLRVRTQRVTEQQEVHAQARQEYMEAGDDQRYVETQAAPQTQERAPSAPAQAQAQAPNRSNNTQPTTPHVRNGSSPRRRRH